MDGPLNDIEAMRGDLRAVSARLGDLTRVLEQGGGQANNTIRVDGGIFAMVASFSFLIVVIAFMIMESRSYNDLSRKIDKNAMEIRAEFGPQLDQLRAWNDVNRGKIAVLEAKTKEK